MDTTSSGPMRCSASMRFARSVPSRSSITMNGTCESVRPWSYTRTTCELLTCADAAASREKRARAAGSLA